MLRILAVLMTLGLAIAPFQACSSKPADKGSSSDKDDDKKKKKTDDDDDDDDQQKPDDDITNDDDAVNDPCKKPVTPATDTATDGAGLALLAELDYGDVKPIIDDKCASGTCHTSAANATGPGDYTKYAGLKAAAVKIASRLDHATKPMPPAGADELTAAEEQKLRDWLTAGAPEGSVGTGTATDDSPLGDNGDPCDDSTDTDTSNLVLFDKFVNPPELKECHDKGLVYYRKTQECHQAQLTQAYTCDRAGVLGAFNNHPDVIKELDKREGGKWIYDQCGMLNGKPAVFFMCLYKDLDAQGQPLCVPAAQLQNEDEFNIGASMVAFGTP